MSTINFLISTLGWSIVHSVWQITFIGIGVKLLLLAFRKSNPVLKYNIILAGLFVIFSTFCITLAIMSDQGHTPSGTKGLLTGTHPAQNEQWIGERSANLLPSANYQWNTFALILQKIDGSLGYIMTAWFAGFLFFAFRFLGSYLYINRLKRLYSIKLPDNWQVVLQEIQSKLGFRRAVTLFESATTTIPMVIGHLKPAIILPLGLITQIPFNQLEAILAHELAHIRRNDFLINLMTSSLEWIFFYHPIFWWLSRNLVLYREHCCDDITIAFCGKAEPLQKALIDLSKNNISSIHIAAALYKNDYQLLNRIKRMKTKNQKNHGKRFNPAGMLLILGVFIIVTAGLSFSPRPSDMHGILKSSSNDLTTNTVIIPAFPPVENSLRVMEPGDILPDTTKNAKKQTSVKEFKDEGVISLELDADGNLLKVKKDGKELTGEEREKYDRLAIKLQELKEEEKVREKNREEIDRVKEQLKETELKMKEVQREYSEIMNEYMKIYSEKNWSSQENTWSFFNDELMNTEEIEALMETNLDLAGIYEQDLLADRIADQENWAGLQKDLLEDQFSLSQDNLYEILDQAELQRDISEEMLRQFEEVKDIQDLKQIELEGHIFEEVIRQELVKDGLIETASGKFSLRLTEKRLVVNGQKQDAELHKKYLRIYTKYSGTELTGDMQVIIED